MTVYIASTEKNKNVIQEDLFIQHAFSEKGASIQIESLDRILETVQPTDTVLLKSIWGYHLDPKKFLEQIHTLEDNHVKLINDYRYIYWNIDKSSYLADISFLGVVPTRKVDLRRTQSTAEIDKDIRRAIEGDSASKFVIKPTISASGYLTFIFDKNELENSCTFELASHKDLDFIIQPFRSEICFGETSVVLIDGQAMYGIRRFPGILSEKRESHYLAVQEVPVEIRNQTESLFRFFKDTFGLPPAICRADFVQHGPGYEIMEVELIDPDLFFKLLPADVLQRCLSALTL